jgi:hypothetical protein
MSFINCLEKERCIRLGISAINFGYGPTSKALGIIKELEKRARINWHVFCFGVSREYFEKELPLIADIEYQLHDQSEADYAKFCPHLDGVIIVADDGSICEHVSKYCDIFFVDGLGFMWRERDLHVALRSAKRYYALNVLDAYENLKTLDIANLRKIEPILQLEGESTPETYETIVHLGGMYVPFSSSTSSLYAMSLAKLIRSVPGSYTVLISKYGRERFKHELQGLPLQTVPQANVIDLYRNANCVMTLTGPTTVIEIANLQRPCIPLIAQNYSQVLTVRNLVQAYGHELSDSWKFLNAAYRGIAAFLPEHEGVAAVGQLNETLLQDSAFIEAFCEIIESELTSKPQLPIGLLVTEAGAAQIADDIIHTFSIA